MMANQELRVTERYRSKFANTPSKPMTDCPPIPLTSFLLEITNRCNHIVFSAISIR